MTRRWWVACAAVIVVVSGAAVAWRWWHDRAPFGPEAIAPTASLELTSYDEAQRRLGADVFAPYAGPGDQLVLGQVSWRPPPQRLAGGHLTILLIDKRTDLMPAFISVASSRQAAVGTGSDGTLDVIADRYPWLRAAKSRYDGSGRYTSGHVVYVTDAEASPLTLVALFPAANENVPVQPPVATAPVALSDLLLAMAFVGPDRQIYWAQRLLG